MDKQKKEFVAMLAAKATRDELQAAVSELELRLMNWELVHGDADETPGYLVMRELDDTMQKALAEKEDYARTLGLDLAAPMVA